MKTSILHQNGISPEVVKLIDRLVAMIPWPERRRAMGDVTLSILDGKARVAETEFGWNRFGVMVGINEHQTGITCVNDLSTRHKPRSEDKNPELLESIRKIMEPQSHADTQLHNTLLYTNMTAQAVHDALIAEGWPETSLPSVRTISNILNRHQYRLRTVQKTKVQKKTPETDAIFQNVRKINSQADADPETLRISVDTKATVHVGLYCRGGKSRGLKAVEAWDHEMRPKKKLVPGGILEPVQGTSFLFFGTSNKTSDFLVDGLELWWQERKAELTQIKKLVINMDNGPECNGHRSQFLYRMTSFADQTGLEVRLIYYPPYHSKYNSIERYWAGLEKSWNGYLLDSVNTVLRRAENFTWRGIAATATLLTTIYHTGVKLCGKAKAALEKRLMRSPDLKWWDICIRPNTVLL